MVAISRRQHRKKKKKKRRFERTSAAILGQVRIVQAPVASRSLHWLHYVWRLSLVALVLMAVAALWLALDSRFYIYHADVVGAERLSSGEVFRASGLAGLHVLWARPSKLETLMLDELPTIESAQIACSLPAECTITIVERQPKVTWEEGEQLWWVDAEGVIFPAEGSLSEGWFVRGSLPRDGEGRLDERVRVALSELWAMGVDDIPSELQYVPSRGLAFINEQGWRVIVGQGAGMAERLRVFEQLAKYLKARDLTPRFVDVRFPGAPYYSLTTDW
jgi:hypothetical protein